MGFRRILVWFLFLAVVGLAGCTTPERTARALFGSWEGDGNSRLIFTEHGLYMFYRKEERVGAGLFAIPRPGQILVQQSQGRYQLRNLWTIEKLEKESLVIVFQDQQKIMFRRSKPVPSGEPQLTGLWRAPAGMTLWNFYEFTPEGGYIQIYWIRRGSSLRRVTTGGQAHVDKGRIVFTSVYGGVHDLEYTFENGNLHLKGSRGRVDSTYTKIDSAKDLMPRT